MSDLSAGPEPAVLAGARAFGRDPIRYAVKLPVVRLSPDLADDVIAEVLKLPPKGLSGEEMGEFRRAQRESTRAQPSDKPGGSPTEDD